MAQSPACARRRGRTRRETLRLLQLRSAEDGAHAGPPGRCRRASWASTQMVRAPCSAARRPRSAAAARATTQMSHSQSHVAGTARRDRACIVRRERRAVVLAIRAVRPRSVGDGAVGTSTAFDPSAAQSPINPSCTAKAAPGTAAAAAGGSHRRPPPSSRNRGGQRRMRARLPREPLVISSPVLLRAGSCGLRESVLHPPA